MKPFPEAQLQKMDWEGGREPWFKLGPFLYRKYKRGIKGFNVSSSF